MKAKRKRHDNAFKARVEDLSDLTRIFHTDLLRKPESLMNTALDSDFDLDSMYSYSPASKPSPALSHQALRLPRHDQYEISGLRRITKKWQKPPRYSSGAVLQFAIQFGERFKIT